MSRAFNVADHYRDAWPVYDTLGRLDGALTPANADKTNWYHTEPVDASEYDGRARPLALSPDFSEIARQVDRTVYVTVNYAPKDYYLDSWDRFSWSDDHSREWKSDANPMPDYEHLMALAPFSDIDLLDDIKMSREAGELETETIEQALDAYIDGFAELCGGRDPVFALDSVGGAYIMIAPSVTAPIADRFSPEDRATIFEKLASRVNDHLDDVRDRITIRIDDHDEFLDPDMIVHKNRLYKAPLSLHADIDGVVTPLSVDEPDYSLTRFTDVDDGLLTETEAWAEDYTADYSDRISELVAALWPDYADGVSWDRALVEWLSDHRSTPERENQSRVRRRSETPDYADKAPVEEVCRALDGLDARKVADDTIVAQWNEDATSGKGKGIYPVWDPSCNGTANYVTEKIWHDTGEGDYGTVVEMALIGAADVAWNRGEIATGADWVRGIKELRRLGYDVPLPDSGGLPEDSSPYYSLDLQGLAEDNEVDGNPYEDATALLKVCLIAREDIPELCDEKPPYKALVALARKLDLELADEEQDKLGRSTYSYARDIYDAIDEFGELEAA